MAEVVAVVGTVASFAQLIGTVIKTVETLARIYGNLRDGPEELRRIAERLLILQAILKSIREFLNDLPEEVGLPADLRQALTTAVEIVQTDLVRLRSLNDGNGTGDTNSFCQRLKFTLIERHAFEKACQYLRDSESTLSCVLQLLTL